MRRRPFVEAMADAMQERLEANAHKDGGGFDDTASVLTKLLEEVYELAQAVEIGLHPSTVLKEAADVANVAGMLAAFCSEKALPSWTDPAS